MIVPLEVLNRHVKKFQCFFKMISITSLIFQSILTLGSILFLRIFLIFLIFKKYMPAKYFDSRVSTLNQCLELLPTLLSESDKIVYFFPFVLSTNPPENILIFV